MPFPRSLLTVMAAGSALVLSAQDPPAREDQQAGWKQAETAKPGEFVVSPGTRIPLNLINSISTKHSSVGDRVYLETAFPIVVSGHVVIPPGSYVEGTVTEIKRPGRIKGRGELHLRFDSMVLPNGVTRDFRARMGGMDGDRAEKLDKEGKVTSEGNKGGDARTIGEAASTGATVGVIVGGTQGRPGLGLGVGSAAGAAAGLIGVLLTRGPDAILAKGTTVEMVLDRPVTFEESEIDFRNAMPRPGSTMVITNPSQQQQSLPGIGRRW
jgi:hypothetical protein